MKEIFDILFSFCGFIGLSFLVLQNTEGAIGLGIILHLFYVKLHHILNK